MRNYSHNFVTGIPTVGIPPMEPLQVSEVDIGNGHGSVRLELTLRDVKMKGLKGLKIVGNK
jgi:hypothetical protein